jgi:hypothetical protein
MGDSRSTDGQQIRNFANGLSKRDTDLFLGTNDTELRSFNLYHHISEHQSSEWSRIDWQRQRDRKVTCHQHEMSACGDTAIDLPLHIAQWSSLIQTCVCMAEYVQKVSQRSESAGAGAACCVTSASSGWSKAFAFSGRLFVKNASTTRLRRQRAVRDELAAAAQRLVCELAMRKRGCAPATSGSRKALMSPGASAEPRPPMREAVHCGAAQLRDGVRTDSLDRICDGNGPSPTRA